MIESGVTAYPRGNGHQRPIVAIESSEILWVQQRHNVVSRILLPVVVGVVNCLKWSLWVRMCTSLCTLRKLIFNKAFPSLVLSTSYRLHDFGISFSCSFQNLEKSLDWTTLQITSPSSLCCIKTANSTKCVRSRQCFSWARLSLCPSRSVSIDTDLHGLRC